MDAFLVLESGKSDFVDDIQRLNLSTVSRVMKRFYVFFFRKLSRMCAWLKNFLLTA